MEHLFFQQKSVLLLTAQGWQQIVLMLSINVWDYSAYVYNTCVKGQSHNLTYPMKNKSKQII